MSAVPGVPSRPLQYSKAIADSDLPSGVKTVCWAIATFANNSTGRAYPTVKKIAQAAGLSEATVSQHTGHAEAKGYLRKDRKTNSSIDYYITVPTVEESPETPIAGRVTEAPARDWASEERAARLKARSVTP